MTTLAKAIGQVLADSGLRCAFGVVGGGNIMAVAGLTAAGLRYVPARHECGAVAMADAYYRVAGEVAVCTTSHGAGFTNVATGLAEAAKHGSGVLLLCGDHPVSGIRRNDIEQVPVATALGAQVLRVTDPERAPDTVAEAVRTARSGRRPVVLCLPAELMSADAPTATPTDSVAPSLSLSATGAELGTVLEVVARARRPLLLAGLGAWHSGAAGPISALADRLGGLLANTMMASGIFADHPWSLGIFGGFASPPAASLIQEADLVLAFGASLDQFTLHRGTLIDPAATVVQVDVTDSATADRVDIHLPADATAAASALLAGLDERPRAAGDWRAHAAPRLRSLRAGQETFDDASTDDRLDPRTLSMALAPLLPAERTLVLDGGHFIAWPAMYWPVADPSHLVFIGAAFQAVGLGFAGGVGAAVAAPERTTVVALGDGGSLMGLPELETLIRTGTSTLVVIYDDAAYGFEVHTYGSAGADPVSTTFTDTDFASVARALGANAVTVEKLADLEAVRVWRADGCRGTLVLDCKVVPTVVASFLADLTGHH